MKSFRCLFVILALLPTFANAQGSFAGDPNYSAESSSKKCSDALSCLSQFNVQLQNHLASGTPTSENPQQFAGPGARLRKGSLFGRLTSQSQEAALGLKKPLPRPTSGQR